VFFLALFAGVASVEVTPIEKVIDLLEGLKKEVETDGGKEAKAYDEFACFCKDTTEEKSKSVLKGKDQIDELSADIADKTQEKKDDSAELLDRTKEQESLATKLAEEEARCAKEKAEYEAEAADLDKAIQGLKDAIKSMEDSKPASLLAIRESLVNTLELAETMNLLKTPKHKAVAALLQQSNGVDPSDPEYKFHSNDIIDLCKDLLKDYKANKKELDEDWAKTKKGCEDMQASLKKKMKANKKAMDALEKSIAKLAKEIAEDRSDLVEAEALMKDDELYLKDMQAQCESRAHDYDQRSAMRGDELGAITSALEVLSKSVKDATKVNVRALLLQRKHRDPVATKPVAATPKGLKAAPVEATIKSISFLQSSSGSLSAEARQQSVMVMLQKEGDRLGSLALSSLAAHIAADPFKKVKGLIQKLIERLLTEAKNEATKKGFCDTELGKAESDRDFRFTEANDLSAELAKLEAKKDFLEKEIDTLTKEIKEETKALKEATKQRKDEKEANMKTLKTSKEGFEAVNEALLILRASTSKQQRPLLCRHPQWMRTLRVLDSVGTIRANKVV
jgi:DNA repair exonuclease SbcCD ATPase subunit